jgi:hypothetical protein
LNGQRAEKMERIRLIRLNGENLPVDLFRDLQTARLMVLAGNRQRFRNCGHGANTGLSWENTYGTDAG